MSTNRWQTVTRRCGAMGPEPMLAPAGLDGSNEVAVECWYWLMAETRRTQYKLRRDKYIREANMDLLGKVLANSQGMAGFYWTSSAREAAKLEARS